MLAGDYPKGSWLEGPPSEGEQRGCGESEEPQASNSLCTVHNSPRCHAALFLPPSSYIHPCAHTVHFCPAPKGSECSLPLPCCILGAVLESTWPALVAASRKGLGSTRAAVLAFPGGTTFELRHHRSVRWDSDSLLSVLAEGAVCVAPACQPLCQPDWHIPESGNWARGPRRVVCMAACR